MPQTPNILKLAIVAAGGSKRVAETFGVTINTASRWVGGSQPFPPDRIDELCALGSNEIAADRLRQYLAARAGQQAAQYADQVMRAA